MPRQWTRWEKAEMFLFAGPVTIAAFVAGVGGLLACLWVFSDALRRPNHVAPRAHCISNLKQFAMAVKLYQQDTYGHWPASHNSNRGLQDSQNWIGKIYPFARSETIFQCPSDSAATDSQKSSYGYNALLAGKTKLKKPDTVVMLLEVQADTNNWTQTGSRIQAVSGHKRHLDGANYAFVDGHVKWFSFRAFTGPNTAPKRLTFDLQ